MFVNPGGTEIDPGVSEFAVRGNDIANRFRAYLKMKGECRWRDCGAETRERAKEDHENNPGNAQVAPGEASGGDDDDGGDADRTLSLRALQARQRPLLPRRHDATLRSRGADDDREARPRRGRGLEFLFSAPDEIVTRKVDVMWAALDGTSLLRPDRLTFMRDVELSVAATPGYDAFCTTFNHSMRSDDKSVARAQEAVVSAGNDVAAAAPADLPFCDVWSSVLPDFFEVAVDGEGTRATRQPLEGAELDARAAYVAISKDNEADAGAHELEEGGPVPRGPGINGLQYDPKASDIALSRHFDRWFSRCNVTTVAIRTTFAFRGRKDLLDPWLAGIYSRFDEGAGDDLGTVGVETLYLDWHYFDEELTDVLGGDALLAIGVVVCVYFLTWWHTRSLMITLAVSGSPNQNNSNVLADSHSPAELR